MSKNRLLQSVNKCHLKTDGDFICRASHSETIRPKLGESGSQTVATRPRASPEKLSYITVFEKGGNSQGFKCKKAATVTLNTQIRNA